MIKDVIIKKLNKYNDERGWLAEIFRIDEDNYQPVMSYVSETKPGIVRGPHEHVYQTDVFVFLGPGNFELHLWDARENSPTKGEYFHDVFGEDNPASIIVPPGVVHGYKCVSDIPGWCINLPNKLFKGKNKKEKVDEIRWEENKNSPYKI